MGFNIFTPISVKNKIYKNEYISRVRNNFNDLRRERVWEETISKMSTKQSTVVQVLAENQREADQMYGFINSKDVEVEEIIKLTCQVEEQAIAGKPVYIIGDSSSIYLGRNKRIKDIEKVGVLTGGTTPGFHTHVNIGINESGDILGLADIILWSRPPKKKRKEGSEKVVDSRTKEERESVRWAMGAENAKKVYAQSSRRTYIFDQEGDDFDLEYDIVNKLEDDFIIRGNRDRKIVWNGEQTTVNKCMEQSKSLGSYKIDLRKLDHYSRTFGKRIKRKARKVEIELRSEKVVLLAPQKRKGKDSLPLYLVEAREITEGVETGEEKVLWRIWTTHPVETFEQAKRIVELYSKRWIVEQFFRTLKKKGLKIEETQFETFEAILKQTTMAMHAAVKIMQLTYARDRFDSQPISDVFNEKERKVLQKVNEKLQGNTEKQENPYPPEKLSWASWIIGRLGGWKGYSSQRPAGPITMLRGLQRFDSYLEAYELFNSD